MQYNKIKYLFLRVIFVFIILLAVISLKFANFSKVKFIEQKSGLAFAAQELPFKKGEKITYNVNLFGIKIGSSQLQFFGPALLDNKEVELIVLSTNVTNLQDVEKIYVDSNSYLPLRVERSVVFFGKKMEIIEDYNLKDNSFTLTKTESGKTTKEVIKSQKPLQNIISLIFLFRKNRTFDIGETFPIALPLLKLQMKVKKIVNFSTANKKYRAYLFESVPKKYRIWLDESPRKIPLRLDGAVGFGNTAMVMTEFIPGEN